MGHFPFLLIKLKFHWAILSKFNIAISVVNGPFFCNMCQWFMSPCYPNYCIYNLNYVVVPNRTTWLITKKAMSHLIWHVFSLKICHLVTVKFWPLFKKYFGGKVPLFLHRPMHSDVTERCGFNFLMLDGSIETVLAGAHPHVHLAQAIMWTTKNNCFLK